MDNNDISEVRALAAEIRATLDHLNDLMYEASKRSMKVEVKPARVQALLLGGFTNEQLEAEIHLVIYKDNPAP